MWLPAFAIPACIARDDGSRHLVARLGASILAATALVAALLMGQAVVAIVAIRRGASGTGGLPWLAWLDGMAIGGLMAAWVGRLMWTLS